MNNFIYIDAGLSTNLFHHANSCRLIAGEAKLRNIPTAVLSYFDIDRPLQEELFAIPWFRCNPYAVYDSDPICGWWRSFEFASNATTEDLRRLTGVGRDDLVYANSVQPPQFRGIINWAKELPEEQRPTVIIEFGTDPGVLAVATSQGNEFFPYPNDPRPVTLRYTAGILTEADQRWLRLATFDIQSSCAFQWVLNFPVHRLPLPQGAMTRCRDRRGTRPITVAVLGHQRPDKGYAMVPELTERLMAARDDIRLLIHNGWPGGMVEQQQALRTLADADRRITLNEDVADPALWSSLLESTDLIICP